IVTVGAALTVDDTLFADQGSDMTVLLNGDYSAGMVFGASTMINVGHLILAGGHSYNFTTVDQNVTAAHTMVVDGSGLDAGDSLHFDASAETDGTVNLIGGAGDDTLIGASTDNTLSGGSGRDTITGGIGKDLITGGGGGDLLSGGDGGHD